MAQALKKPKVDKDRFTADGVRMFNASLGHGTVYSDGFEETKFIQEYEGREVMYRGDGLPVGYEPGKPLPRPVDETEAENVLLKRQIAELQAGQQAMLKALAELKQVSAAPGQPIGKKETGKVSEAPADGAQPHSKK